MIKIQQDYHLGSHFFVISFVVNCYLFWNHNVITIFQAE